MCLEFKENTYRLLVFTKIPQAWQLSIQLSNVNEVFMTNVLNTPKTDLYTIIAIFSQHTVSSDTRTREKIMHWMKQPIRKKTISPMSAPFGLANFAYWAPNNKLYKLLCITLFTKQQWPLQHDSLSSTVYRLISYLQLKLQAVRMYLIHIWNMNNILSSNTRTHTCRVCFVF